MNKEKAPFTALSLEYDLLSDRGRFPGAEHEGGKKLYDKWRPEVGVTAGRDGEASLPSP